jgi:hypothetical protein
MPNGERQRWWMEGRRWAEELWDAALGWQRGQTFFQVAGGDGAMRVEKAIGMAKHRLGEDRMPGVDVCLAAAIVRWDELQRANAGVKNE